MCVGNAVVADSDYGGWERGVGGMERWSDEGEREGGDR